jgi:pimeloyl-ACP methyl ester carboxylesterase
MGAAASLFAALEDPTAAQALILANPPTCYEQRAKFVPMYLESAALARSEGLEAAKAIAATKARPPIFLESEEGRAMFDLGWKEKFAMGQERYCAALEGSATSDLPSREILRKVEVPCLILAWPSDVQHPVDTAKMLAGTLPNAELHIAESWAEIEDFPRVMRTFLDRMLASG